MDKLVVLVTCKAKINKSLKVSELFAFFISRNKNILFRFPSMKMFSMESTLPPPKNTILSIRFQFLNICIEFYVHQAKIKKK